MLVRERGLLRSRCVGRALSHRHEVCAAATGGTTQTHDSTPFATRPVQRGCGGQRIQGNQTFPSLSLRCSGALPAYVRRVYTIPNWNTIRLTFRLYAPAAGPRPPGRAVSSEPRTAPRTRDVAARHTRLGTHRTARGGPRGDAGRGFSVRLRHVTRQHAHHTHASELIAAVLTQNSPRARPHEPCVKRSSFPTMCAHT